MQGFASFPTRAPRTKNVVAFAIAIVAMVLWGSSASAQSGAGSIQGTVTDPTHAVVPGAIVHVVKEGTGVATDSKSNGAGFFQVPALFVGTYRVTVTAPGFETYRTSVELQVAQTAVIDPVLPPGEVTTQVVVNADTLQLITKESGTIGSTLENARIQQLPEDGRFIDNLVGITTPGLLGGQNLNGANAEALEYTVDGVPTMNGQFGAEPTRKTQLPDPDTVQEVRVETSGSGAQFATPGTAIVSTKSGSNKFHGTAFETARNNAIGVARPVATPTGAIPKYDRNEFGVSVGGPIRIPRFYNGRDKSFFFVAYERFSLVQDTVGTGTVPTAAMRMGDFSGLINKAGNLQVLYDPSTTANSTACAASPNAKTGKPGPNPYCRTPFPNNQIPISEISPLAALYYQLIPLPAGQFAAADPLVHFNLNFTQKQYQYVPQETFRLDHVFNETNRAYLRFTDISSPVNTNPSGFYNLAAGGIPAGAADGYADNPSQSFQTGLGYTHIFSPTFFSETIFAQQWLDDTQISGVAPNVNYEQMLNLPNNFGEVGFPAVNGLLAPLQSSQTANRHISQIIWNADENLTKTVGRHQLHFGGRYRLERYGVQGNGQADTITTGVNPTGVYQPSSGAKYTAVANTGYADASFFLGSAGSYSVNLEPPYSHFHDMEADAYLQDDFHVSKNLTLNLGLRYEAHPAIYTAHGLANTFDLKNDAQVLAVTPAQLIAEGYTTQAIITNDQNIGVKFETAQQAGLPSKLMYDYNLNFLPRVGFAWQPFGARNTVIRGAYGVYDYPTPLGLYATPTATNNPFTAGYTASYSGAAQAVDNLPNETIRYNSPQMFGILGKNTANVVNTGSITSILPGTALVSTSPNYAPENVTEVNATIEQQFKGNSALRVSWVFTHGANLPIIDQYNQSPSDYQYETAFGIVPPTGGASVIGTSAQNTYAATATGPYDQTTWGNSSFRTKAGWSNDNALQINYQRLFHRGSAYQIIAEYSKAMAAIGNVAPDADYPGVQGTLGSTTSPYGPVVTPGFAPPPRPAGLPNWADYKDMEYYQNYKLDSTTPVLHFKGNGLLDLPIGRGKQFLGHVNRFWNEIVGGYQIGGTFNVASQVFAAPAGNWGPTNPITLYKHKIPTTDCRSGVCEASFLWYNGYLPPTVLTPGEGGVCTTNCVTGIPSTYKPYETPIDTTPLPTGVTQANCTGASCYYNTDTVLVTLKDGTQVTEVYDGGAAGSNRFSKVFINGPINWGADASLFKVFPITDGVRLRVNFDAFNVFNSPGENNPDANGLQHFNTNAGSNPARTLQLTARVLF